MDPGDVGQQDDAGDRFIYAQRWLLHYNGRQRRMSSYTTRNLLNVCANFYLAHLTLSLSAPVVSTWISTRTTPALSRWDIE